MSKSVINYLDDESRGSFFFLIRRLLSHLSSHRKYQFTLLSFLMLINAGAEVISLGAVLPFIAVLMTPERVFEFSVVSDVANFFHLTSAQQLILPLTGVFICIALIAGVIRIALLLVSNRLAYGISGDISIEIYRRTLYQSYATHISRNSSDIISGITSKASSVTSILSSILSFISSTIVFVSIVAALVTINPSVALIAAIGFCFSYGLITLLSKKKLYTNSKCIANKQTQVVKALQEGLGGIRDILLDGAQAIYCEIYKNADIPLRRAQGNSAFIGQSPRYIMEALAMVLMALLSYGLSLQSGGVARFLPTLVALAIGAQRLLPALQQIYISWTNIAGNRMSLVHILSLLEQPMPNALERNSQPSLPFNSSIQLDGVYFRYSTETPWVLNGITLLIPRGARVGFVGRTGSGKSTILDILMGLLLPTQGKLLVDNQAVHDGLLRAWQRNIAHVPQTIYLPDTTLAENIAFGAKKEDIDFERVRQAAQQAQIAEFIESQSEGYYAHVGERGIRLSGGQRQRIGIARALYKRANILVLDEATSALDNRTEKDVMDSVQNLNRNLTILIVAHRLSTVKNCDIIFELENGRIITQGHYDQLVQSSPSFLSMSGEIA